MPKHAYSCMTHTALSCYVNKDDQCLYLPAGSCEILVTSAQTSFPPTSALKTEEL